MTTVLLAEDHTLVRSGIRALLERAGGYQVVGEASNGREALRLAGALTPDLALVDVAMPELDGIAVAREMPTTSPRTRVLMLSMQSNYHYVAQALRLGAGGYVLKDAAFDELLAAIGQVLAGQTYLSAAVTTPALQRGLANPATLAESGLDKLTPRERQVLQRIAEGASTPEIAGEFTLSPRTVETYRERIMLKLDLHSIAALTRFAVGHGLCAAEG